MFIIVIILMFIPLVNAQEVITKEGDLARVTYTQSIEEKFTIEDLKRERELLQERRDSINARIDLVNARLLAAKAAGVIEK